MGTTADQRPPPPRRRATTGQTPPGRRSWLRALEVSATSLVLVGLVAALGLGATGTLGAAVAPPSMAPTLPEPVLPVPTTTTVTTVTPSTGEPATTMPPSSTTTLPPPAVPVSRPSVEVVNDGPDALATVSRPLDRAQTTAQLIRPDGAVHDELVVTDGVARFVDVTEGSYRLRIRQEVAEDVAGVVTSSLLLLSSAPFAVGLGGDVLVTLALY